jgi:O-antigen/teichoic acid export membrane protein
MRQSLPSFEVHPTPMYRSILAFSLPLIAVQGMGVLNTNIDIYMIGYLLNSAQLGVYNIALQLGNVVTSILATAGFLLPPMLTRLQQQNKHEEMVRIYQVMTKWMVVLILPLFIILFFAPRFVISSFFGGSYKTGAVALQILLAGKLIAVVLGLNGPSLIALGENKVISYIVAIELAVNVVLNYMLVPIVGIAGAAIAMSVSIVAADLIGAAVLFRRFGLHPFTSSVLSPIAAVGVLAVSTYGVLSFSGLPTLLTVVVVGVSYLPIVAIFALEPEDEELLSRVEDRTGYDLEIVRQTVNALR